MRIFLLVLLLVVAALAGYGFTLPEQTTISRSTLINASPEQVFVELNSFQNFNQWSPWHAEMPADEYGYEGPPAGVGATMTWSGGDSGEGRQTIIESVPNEKVRTKLDFGIMGTPHATFTLAPEGEATMVTWSLDAHYGNNILQRYVGAFFVEPGLPRFYEKGLGSLKWFIEARVQEERTAAAAALEAAMSDAQALAPQVMPGAPPEIVTLDPRAIAYISSEADMTKAGDAGRALAEAFAQIGGVVASAEIELAGAPLSVTRAFDPDGKWVFDAAFPVAALPVAAPADSGDVAFGKTPGGRAVRIVHKGPYETLADAYTAAKTFADSEGVSLSETAIEEYVSDPEEMPEAELLTNVYIFVK